MPAPLAPNRPSCCLTSPRQPWASPQTEQVLDVVKRLRETGHAVVYISHNLRDIFDVSDRITVLRHGGNVARLRHPKHQPGRDRRRHDPRPRWRKIQWRFSWKVNTGRGLVERFRQVRESRFGAFVPVLLALAAIWIYFGISEPAFLSARNFYFLFMQSAVVGTLGCRHHHGAAAWRHRPCRLPPTQASCAALMAVLIANLGVSAPLACLIAIGAGITLSAGQGILVSYVGDSVLCGDFGRPARVSGSDAESPSASTAAINVRETLRPRHHHRGPASFSRMAAGGGLRCCFLPRRLAPSHASQVERAGARSSRRSLGPGRLFCRARICPPWQRSTPIGASRSWWCC